MFFVIIMAAKQEVAGRRSGMDGQVNQAQDFHIQETSVHGQFESESKMLSYLLICM